MREGGEGKGCIMEGRTAVAGGRPTATAASTFAAPLLLPETRRSQRGGLHASVL